MKENEFYLSYCLELATQSPDPSTQNAACLVDPQSGSIVASEYNRFPNGVEYLESRWRRPDKYKYIEHAERNVIYQAAKYGISTNGLVMFCPWFSCADCARGIIQSGIKEVIGLKIHSHKRWQESNDIGDIMLAEAGVKYSRIDIETQFIKLRRDGEEVLV